DKRCAVCHSTEDKAYGVPLWELQAMLESPREIVLPGNYEESGLFIAITRKDDKRMPPPELADALTSEEIETIRKWIEIGVPEE
ncbi:MAG: hypothetical protein HY072_03420, partial [Deltaproteobacteria bacterium]|nr:hypothetical protein [Deltaproteobacteria bacterium]